MSERPTCGKCGGKMTPENSMVHPELFLHDGCLPEELQSWRQRLPATDFSYNPADLKSEVERLKVDLKEAQAAAAVMREALTQFVCETCNGTHVWKPECVGCLSGDGFCTCQSMPEEPCCQCQSDNGLREVYSKLESATSTTAGTALLARMAEAEWLVANANHSLVRGVGLKAHRDEWLNRAATFLKGEEESQKRHLEDCSIYSTAKICDCPYSKSTISKQDVDQAMRDATAEQRARAFLKVKGLT